MKNLTYFLFCTALIAPIAVLGQTDTIYLVKNLPDGTIRNEGKFKVVSASCDGIMVSNYLEGNILVSRGSYEDRSEMDKTGQWAYYFEDGGMSETQYYKNGKLEGESIAYYPSGELYFKKEFTNGDLVTEEYYSLEGKPVAKETLEKLPEFPGGEEGLFRFLGNEIRYPSKAKDAGIKGIVYIKFTVDTLGRVGNFEILRSVHPLLDSEAARAVEAMPLWTTGIRYGKKATIYYTLPVKFHLR